jgi:hypothetical protein
MIKHKIIPNDKYIRCSICHKLTLKFDSSGCCMNCNQISFEDMLDDKKGE